MASAAPPSPPPLWLDAAAADALLPGSGGGDVIAALALDEALLEEAHEGVRGETVVRTWMATRPVVVVGSSSRVEEEVDVAGCAAAGVPILRRPSGGATVILGPGCVMWSVVTPHPAGVPAVERIHAAMLDPIVEALQSAGLPVSRQGTSDLVLAVAESGAAALMKVSGNALRVRRHGVLYHGTLLDGFDLALAAGSSNIRRASPTTVASGRTWRSSSIWGWGESGSKGSSGRRSAPLVSSGGCHGSGWRG